MGLFSSSQFYFILLFCLLFIATNFVNKYVLSVLKFTYPTIFQGWQTLVGVMLMRIMISTGSVEPLLLGFNRTDAAKWLPGMMLFVTSIYAGSKALASLSVPAFFSLHNIILVFKWTGDVAINRQLTGVYLYIMLMLTVVSSVAVARTDPQFSSEGYFWMSVHVVSSGLLEIYTKLMKGRLKLSAVEKLYSNYIYSVIVLAPSSYFLGDALEATKFPHLYFAKFYMGCILSGVFGTFLNLSLLRFQDMETSSFDMQASTAVAKVLGSLFSLFVFSISVTGTHALWLVVNHLCALACSESLKIATKPSPWSSQSETILESGVSGSEYLKRNDLQQDMIRIDVKV